MQEEKAGIMRRRRFCLRGLRIREGKVRINDNIAAFSDLIFFFFFSERPPASRSLSTRGPKKQYISAVQKLKIKCFSKRWLPEFLRSQKYSQQFYAQNHVHNHLLVETRLKLQISEITLYEKFGILYNHKLWNHREFRICGMERPG